MLASPEINTDQISAYATVSHLVDSFDHHDHSAKRASNQQNATLNANGSGPTKLQHLEAQMPQAKLLPKTVQIINVRTPKEQALKRISDVVESDRNVTAKELASIHRQLSLVSAD